MALEPGKQKGAPGRERPENSFCGLLFNDHHPIGNDHNIFLGRIDLFDLFLDFPASSA